MKTIGWLLDVYINGDKAILWIRSENGEVIRLTDQYTSDFYVEPEDGVQPEDLACILSNHPNVLHYLFEKKFTSVNMRKISKVLHIFIDHTQSFQRVLSDIEKLGTVKAFFNIDILHVQRYLFQRGIAPTSRVEAKYDSESRLLCLHSLDDQLEIKPPPFTTLIFDIEINSEKLTPQVERDPISKVLIFDETLNLKETFEGEERWILSNFSDYVTAKDPDFLVSPHFDSVLTYLLERAKILDLNVQLGREEDTSYQVGRFIPYAHKGRVSLDLHTFLGRGIAGVVERSRFTLAPAGLSARWPAGRTIDSRQCYEALQVDVLLPKTIGFFKYVTTAKDTIFSDKGGLILAPKVGLHENVAELDYESMYPHIIIKHNVSYETVTAYSIDKTREGFLGELTKKVLGRRLYFKHLRKKYPKESQEWLWCEQRQLALKEILVCIYGYSGCFANRFNNVRAYEEINKIARETLVQTMNISIRQGFEVIYADSDSIFVKKEDASQEDYENLAKTISEEVRLPITLDHHYKFLVLLTQETHPELEATRRYFGKLTSGELYYRGIELRRHDVPSFFKNFQKRLLEILFDAESAERVEKEQLKKAYDWLAKTYDEIMKGNVDIEKLVVSKVLRKLVNEYRSKQPHVVAATQMMQKGKKLKTGEVIKYVYVNEGHSNPFRRVLPAFIISSGHCYYDKEKYVDMVLDVAKTVLGTFGFKTGHLSFKRIRRVSDNPFNMAMEL